VIDPIGTNYDRVIGQWDQNGISDGDAKKARLTYGIGSTFYVQSDHSGDGNGTLEDPYRDLAQARQKCAKDSRIIVLSKDGTWLMVQN
jgi:hypothetical protein